MAFSKLTKGLKLKINKKKSNWKSLKSSDSLPPTPSEEYMLTSDTEAELYNAKMNVQANRSFCTTTYDSRNENTNTNNILSGLNSTNLVSRSKTYNPKTTTTYNYNSRPSFGTNTQSFQNNTLYPTSNNITESRKNSFQTLYATSPQNSNYLTTQPIPIQFPSSSNNTTPIHSAPNSPISIDSSDTVVNEIKANSNNPFMMDQQSKTINKTNNKLNINTTNMDPALTHTLISPIEFDGAGNEIKKQTVEATATTTQSQITDNKTTTKQENPSEPVRTKSVKRMKPLITFDKPIFVSPMAVDSDSDEYVRGRKRSSKKSKKYTKKRSSNLVLKTNLKDMDVDNKNSNYTQGKFSSEPTSAVIAARANIRLNSPRSPCSEEDDDVPLGIIQYKCLSSILKESAPPNISSLQSNTKSSYKTHIKENYGYISPPINDKYEFPRFTNYYYQENYVM